MATIAIRMVVTAWPREIFCTTPNKGMGAMGMISTIP